MDLLNILINPHKVEDVCFLCFKKSNETTDLNDYIEIHDEYFDLNLTLRNIIKSLFPSHDLILNKACEDCSTLIIKLFSLLQRSCMKNEMVQYLIDNIEEKLYELDFKLATSCKPKKSKIKVTLPTAESILLYKKVVENAHCEKCDMKFNSNILLKRHMKIAHKNTNNAIICDVCGKAFNKSSALKAHLNCHKEKQCPYCQKSLKTHAHFNLHVKSHTSPVRTKKRNYKLYTCSVCEYTSRNKQTLETHMNKVHLNIQPFICDICQKGFHKKYNLKQHLLTHRDVKDKTCDICGGTFVNERTLQEHLRLHTGQKPFKCDICDLGFITVSRRYEHMKRKHMEKNETCLLCAKKFGLKKDLKVHLKNVHGAETNNVVLKFEIDENQSSLA